VTTLEILRLYEIKLIVQTNLPELIGSGIISIRGERLESRAIRSLSSSAAHLTLSMVLLDKVPNACQSVSIR